MKPLFQWLLGATLLTTLSLLGIPTVRAQGRTSSLAATSDVYIVQGIAIYKTVDMRFGAIVPGTAGGTLTLSTSGSRTKTGTLFLPANQSVSAATFVVLGPPSQTFSLSIPTSITLGRSGGSETMSITNFVSSPSQSGTLDSGGAANVNVGATLTVGASQTIGQYVGSFTVTVSYP